MTLLARPASISSDHVSEIRNVSPSEQKVAFGKLYRHIPLPTRFVLSFVFFIKLVLDCWNTGDWGGIRGYPVKFAIGFISVFFDLIFLLQVKTFGSMCIVSQRSSAAFLFRIRHSA